MRTPHSIDDTSSFRIRRSLMMTANGIASDVDENAKGHLDELNELLGKQLFQDSSAAEAGTTELASTGPRDKGERATAAKAPNQAGAAVNDPALSFQASAQSLFFSLPLSAKHVPAFQHDATSWEDGSLGAYLATHESKGGYTLSDHIDKTAELAQLKYVFLDRTRENWAVVPFNSRVVLEAYPNITDYLIAFAYHRLAIRDPDALRHVIIDNRAGTRRFADYALAGAARTIIDREQIKVAGYNDNDGPFLAKLTASPVPLSALSLQKVVRDRIREFMFDRDEEGMIRQAKIFKSIPAGLLPPLVKYLQQSPFVTKANVDQFLPGIVLQVMNQTGAAVPEEGGEPADEDFHVQFEDDSDGAIEIDRSAVLCAAQLYHSMVLGEELDVFGAVHFLAHQRMNTDGGMRVEDKALRANLQRYVLDSQYIDLGRKGSRPNGRSADKPRTRPAERQMFYRQVFDEGNSEVPANMLVNRDFKRLWKVLMLESARYLDRAQASMNPESFVSRQNVMQAVEDLQYNLSTHCTGMATVLSPAVDAELNFVLEAIVKHEEVLRQIVPAGGGTWKRAIDKLNVERRNKVGPASTLYNKAMFGKGIIEMIADYTPAGFENDGIFSAFISKVDAFVTTQSILQRPMVSLKDAQEDEGDEPHDEMPDMMPGSMPSAPATSNNGGGTPADEWDF